MRKLNVSSESAEAIVIRKRIEDRVVGQKDGVSALVDMIEKYRAEIFDKSKPIGSILFVGPTGSGKTLLTEAFCRAVQGDRKKCLKIDCAEYQHSHEIAKLLGSPPGYLGHRETPPLLTQSRVDQLKTKDFPFSIIVFDEIEKASDALWHLMLGILDKGTVTLGTNETTDLTKTIILMTSNAGTGEMNAALGKSVGFHGDAQISDEKVADIGIKAAKRKFTAEFINRIDKVVACNALTKESLRRIIDVEIVELQTEILMSQPGKVYIFVTDTAKEAILEEGFDTKYNARNIRRVIDTQIQLPVAKIIASKQLKAAERVYIDWTKASGFSFYAN